MTAIDHDAELLADAVAQKPDALVRLFVPLHVDSFRLAVALTGARSVAESVSQLVIGHALRAMSRWDAQRVLTSDVAAPPRIVRHRTIQLCRVREAKLPDPDTDPLVLAAETPSPAYRAFVRSLRTMPPQPFEAVLLTECEQLPDRMVATSMDCSVTAAQQHLRVAQEQLHLLAGEHLPAMLETLRAAYRSHEPDEHVSQSVVERAVRKSLRPKRVRRLAYVLIAIALVAVLIWLLT